MDSQSVKSDRQPNVMICFLPNLNASTAFVGSSFSFVIFRRVNVNDIWLAVTCLSSFSFAKMTIAMHNSSCAPCTRSITRFIAPSRRFRYSFWWNPNGRIFSQDREHECGHCDRNYLKKYLSSEQFFIMKSFNQIATYNNGQDNRVDFHYFKRRLWQFFVNSFVIWMVSIGLALLASDQGRRTSLGSRGLSPGTF